MKEMDPFGPFFRQKRNYSLVSCQFYIQRDYDKNTFSARRCFWQLVTMTCRNVPRLRDKILQNRGKFWKKKKRKILEKNIRKFKKTLRYPWKIVTLRGMSEFNTVKTHKSLHHKSLRNFKSLRFFGHFL